MSNFNVTNVGILLLGVLLVLAAYYDKQVGEIIKAVINRDMSVFTGVPLEQKATGSSTGQTGFDGNGGFVGGTGGVGSW